MLVNVRKLGSELSRTRNWVSRVRNTRAFFRSPISKLSDDILIYIFIILSDPYDERKVRNNTIEEHKDRRVVLSHVCGRWRNIVLNLPSLWSYLAIPAYRPKKLRVYLSRSQQSPLFLHVSYPPFNGMYHYCFEQELSDCFRIIADHGSKIKTWHMLWEYLPIYLHIPPFIHQFNRLTTLILESATIGQNTKAFKLPIDTPMLDTLHIRDVFPDLTWKTLRQIRKLFIVINKSDWEPQTILGVLSMCQGVLEDLEICVEIFPRFTYGDLDAKFKRQIDLCNLQRFSFVSRTGSGLVLLKYLNIPTTASWNFVLNFYDISALREHFHNPLDDSVDISIHRSHFLIQNVHPHGVSTGSTQRLLLYSPYHTSLGNHESLPPPPLQSLALSLSSTMTSLHISIQNLEDFKSITFEFLYLTPALRTLVVGLGQSRRLSRRCIAVQISILFWLCCDPLEREGTKTWVCLCANLRTLVLVGFDFMDSLIGVGFLAGDLIECVSTRKRMGCFPLDVCIFNPKNMFDKTKRRLHEAIDNIQIQNSGVNTSREIFHRIEAA